ncbi:MAG TPA: PrsW family glutamic-type intramembrane protease [Methanocorpusculum sp.]|nr:PrsW family glutamic-type intramembrane protease [Methanocorpusculum sp.]
MEVELNILLCIAAPLLVMFYIISDKSVRRVLLFLIIGMIAGFAAGFGNSLTAQIAGLTSVEAALYTAPVLEECLKAFPIVIYFLIFKPDFKRLLSAAIACGAGFATIENVTYLINGMSDSASILLRGFGTGVMHAMTVALFAAFLWYVTQNGIRRSWFIWIMCGFGILASGITLHGCYNLLVNSSGYAVIGYLIPIAIAVVYGAGLFIREKRKRTAEKS